jgi:molecular chaperone DnaJ
VGEVIKLKGREPRFRGYGKGDLLVRVAISVPEKLTSQQRALIEQLGKEFGDSVQTKGRRLLF